MELVIKEIKSVERIYHAKILQTDSNDDIYYSEKFLNYDDAVDKCNTEFYKLENKKKYKKIIDIIK